MLALRTLLPQLAVVLSFGLVVLATLVPSGGDTFEFARCAFCSPRALADGIGNVGLFVPLALALSAAGVRTRTTIAIGVALTVAIEVLQRFVPGRDPSVGDIIANAAGIIGGAMLAAYGHALLRPSRELRVRLAWAAALICAAVVAATGFLVAPSIPSMSYWGQWTPQLKSLEPYRGEVTRATMGGVDVPPVRIEDSEALRRRMAAGEPVHLDVVAGPPPSRVSSIFSIADEEARRVFLVGAVNDDVVFRYRTRAVDWRLDQPDIRSAAALAGIAPGQPIAIDVVKQEKGFCIAAAGRQSCGLGYGPGDGWSLLVSSAALPVPARTLLQGAWVAALTVLIGYWSRDGLRSIGPLLLAFAALIAVPWFTALLEPRPHEWLGAVMGAAAGAGAGRLWR